MKMRILVINPGSTSTKVAVYEDDRTLWTENLEHSKEELELHSHIIDQFDMRKVAILGTLAAKQVDLSSLSAVVGRGGLLRGVQAGAYVVDPVVIEELQHNPVLEHASNLGAWLAHEIAEPLGIPSYIYDPVTVDEMIPLVRVTGLAEMTRIATAHNLNMRAAALKLAKSVGKVYRDLRIIVAHLGGGITLTLHDKGRVVDVVTDDEGPFSPERAGGLPGYQLIAMATSPGTTRAGLMKKVQRQGGLISNLGTPDVREVERRIDSGDAKAALVYEAMALGISRGVARLAVVVCGNVDYIVLTGGIAHSERFTELIKERVSFIAPVHVLPGENEMEALALGALRVLRGEEKAHKYSPPR